jgi:hypothetical protein
MLRAFVTPLAAALAPLLVIAPDALAQEGQPEVQTSIVEACQAPEHRQFDFWLGDFEVSNQAGAVVGENRIVRVSGGCGLLESWRGANGNEGTSLNWFDPQTGHWNQLWVGSGLYLSLTGGVEDGEMVLSGERQSPQGVAKDRITWMPLDDGRVRQVWEVSRDSGSTWQVVFDGMYTRR